MKQILKKLIFDIKICSESQILILFGKLELHIVYSQNTVITFKDMY